jgi:hypothetical protein
MLASRSVVSVLLRALGDFSLHPQGRPCGRPSAALRPGNATAPPGRLGPRASVTNVRIPTDAIDQIRPTGWLRKAHLFHVEQVGRVEVLVGISRCVTSTMSRLYPQGDTVAGGTLMGTAASPAPTSDRPAAGSDRPAAGRTASIGGPVWVAWREGTLTRAEELEALCSWVRAKNSRKGGWVRAKNSRKNDEVRKNGEILASAICLHLDAAREAARAEKLQPKKWFRNRFFRNGPLIERAISNLDAAEAHLLNLAPADYIYGQMPCLLRHVRSHLPPTDPARQEFERIAQRLGIKDPDHPLVHNPKGPTLAEKEEIVEEERGKIVTTVRAASSAALREHVRLRSFRNVVVVTSVAMALLAFGVAITGLFRPTLIPLCFAPEESGKAVVVCPTAQSGPFIPAGGEPQSGVPVRDIDDVVAETANPPDLMVVELVGLTAAAIATAAAIRRIKGSSERYGLPVALAALKLPTGAITAFLGLLLMRGQFVPGLSALDTSAQILAWALVFGYAQQLFTRLVDQQGQTVLDNVRGADRPQPSPTP